MLIFFNIIFRLSEYAFRISTLYNLKIISSFRYKGVPFLGLFFLILNVIKTGKNVLVINRLQLIFQK